MTVTITRPCIDANDPTIWRNLSEAQRAELVTLLEQHGGDAHRTAAITYDVVDAPLLRITTYQRDADGRVFVGTDDKVAISEVEVALRSPLPAWWTPQNFMR